MYLRVFVCEVSVQLIANGAVSPFDYRAFHVGMSTYLKLNALFEHVLK